MAGRIVNGKFYTFCDLSSNASYLNELGTGCVDCVNERRFDFTNLETIARNIASSCVNDTRLAKTTISGKPITPPALTAEACRLIAGPTWTEYPGQDIWNR